MSFGWGDPKPAQARWFYGTGRIWITTLIARVGRAYKNRHGSIRSTNSVPGRCCTHWPSAHRRSSGSSSGHRRAATPPADHRLRNRSDVGPGERFGGETHRHAAADGPPFSFGLPNSTNLIAILHQSRSHSFSRRVAAARRDPGLFLSFVCVHCDKVPEITDLDCGALEPSPLPPPTS